jgi:GNAT superfamily N-acetyltransferase
MRALGERVVEVLREEGLRGLWIRALAVTVYRRLLLFALDLAQYPGADGQPDGLEVGELDITLIGEYRRMRPDTPAAEVRRRLAAGQSCIFVRRSGKLISARWIDTRRAEVEYLGLSFGLPPGAAHLYDVYTAPEARRARVGRATFPRYVAMLSGMGIERLIVTSLPENVGGVGLIRSAGYRPIGRVGAIRLGPLRASVGPLRHPDLGDGRRFDPALE